METINWNEEIKKWLDGNRYPITEENVKDLTRVLTSWNQIYIDTKWSIYDEESAIKAWLDLNMLNKV